MNVLKTFLFFFFFFKQKTAYEIYQCDWSSDVCSSDLVKKDTTFAMLLEAQSRGWLISYMQQQDLFLENGQAWATARQLQVQDNSDDWYQLTSEKTTELASLDVILMRKDPPFDMEYIYSTYLLELAESAGAKVINKPQSLRDANEKLFITNFPQCIAPTRSEEHTSELQSH